MINLSFFTAVTEELLNHSQILLVFHGIDTIANISINNEQLLPNPNNMFVRYRYNIRDKLITVCIFSHNLFQFDVNIVICGSLIYGFVYRVVYLSLVK